MKNNIIETKKDFYIEYEECPKCGSTNLEQQGKPGGNVIWTHCKDCQYNFNF